MRSSGAREGPTAVKVNRIKNYWKKNNAFYGVNAIFDIELTKDDLTCNECLRR